VVRLPIDLELKTEQFTVFGTYSMFYRGLITPDKTLINTFKNGAAHTTLVTNFIFRKSTDGGLTFTGANGITPYDAIEVAGLGTDKLNNPTPIMLRNNRIAVFFQVYNSTPDRYKTGFVYSDDLGQTWSNLVICPNPPIAEWWSKYAPYFITAEPIYLPNGNFLMPYSISVNNTFDQTMDIVAEFSFSNGTYSINMNYAIIYDGRGSQEVIGELEWTDCGGGEITIIARTGRNMNYLNDSVPVMFHSTDYGKNWAVGSLAALTLSDIENSRYNSGYAYLEGVGVSMGTIATFNDCLPTINLIEVNSVKWLLINYWIREEMTELMMQTIQRITIIKYADFKTFGVNAIKQISETLFDEPVQNVANENGGNGNGVVYGEEVLFFQYTQPTLTTTLWTVPIRKSLIDSLITAYNNAL